MTEPTAPEKIVINGQEYDPEQANQLIELGSKYQEMESKLNTSLDKVYPEYTKASQRASELERQLEARNAEFARLQQEQQARQQQAQQPEDVRAAREAARKLGLADEDYLKEKGYMTREEVDSYFAQKQNEEKAAQDVLAEASKLEREIDGSDGRQPFNPAAVMSYAYVNGVTDLRQAYDQMNEKYNSAWKERQIEAQQREGLTTLKAGGKKEPQRAKITNDNLGDALGEWLNGLPE